MDGSKQLDRNELYAVITLVSVVVGLLLSFYHDNLTMLLTVFIFMISVIIVSIICKD